MYNQRTPFQAPPSPPHENVHKPGQAECKRTEPNYRITFAWGFFTTIPPTIISNKPLNSDQNIDIHPSGKIFTFKIQAFF